MSANTKIVVIGGSAGSLGTIMNILKLLPLQYNKPVIVVVHRLKNVTSEMDKLLSAHAGRVVIEPDDKAPVENEIYLAPQNYHLLIEEDGSFSLDYSEAVHFSRPSIDVTFESVARVYKSGAVAVLLSGANADGTKGIAHIVAQHGSAIVQSPDSAEYAFMPASAIDANNNVQVFTPDEITHYLQHL